MFSYAIPMTYGIEGPVHLKLMVGLMARRLPYLALAVAVVVTAAVVLLVRSGSDLPEGPLRDPGDPPSAASLPVELGQPFSYGLLYLDSPVDRSLVVDEVRLMKATAGLRIIGQYLTPPYRPGENGFGPPGNPGLETGVWKRSTWDPLPTVLPARQVWEVILVLQIDRPGWYEARGLAVHYHDGTQTHVAHYPSYFFSVCYPPEADGSCRSPELGA